MTENEVLPDLNGDDVSGRQANGGFMKHKANCLNCRDVIHIPIVQVPGINTRRLKVLLARTE